MRFFLAIENNVKFLVILNLFNSFNFLICTVNEKCYYYALNFNNNNNNNFTI